MATDALTLEGINALYGDSHVLYDVSFRLAPGRVLALLGRNGAGKTTCMSAVIGFLPPRDGAVRLFGEPVTRLAPEAISRKGIGLVPQGRRIFPTLTVRENLTVARQLRPGVERPWTVERVFELFPRLHERHAQTAGSLSGGEQQMLAISRALMGNPRVLLMDEPSEGLSPIIVDELMRALKRPRDQDGLTILLVEQNTRVALSFSPRTLVMNRGRIVYDGSSEALGRDRARLDGLIGVAGG